MRFRVGIICVGDELLIGHTINTNTSKIGKLLTQEGFHITLSVICPDDRKSLKDLLDLMLPVNDAIVISGGLGPTHDDITKDILAEYFDDNLIHNQEIMDRVEEYFRLRNREMREVNKNLALFPENATEIMNNVGTAPGIHYHKIIDGKSKDIFSIPGVPREMNDMLTGYVKEVLNKRMNNDFLKIKYHTIQTSGIGESDLASLIGDVSDFLDESSTLAFLPSTRGVRIRIGVQGKDEEIIESELLRLENHISKNIQKYIVGSEDLNKQDAIREMLSERNIKVAVAESCTAGMLGGYLTEKPGAAGYFEGGIISYSNEVKQKQLGVSSESLKKYGAVSEQVSIEMAEGVRQKLGVDISLSITGIAGPEGGTEDKPVGTVWIAISTPEGNKAFKNNFGNNRDNNRELSVTFASNLLYKYLKNGF